MDPLKEKFYQKATALKAEIKNILKENGETQVDTVTLSQVYGGMRGIKSMIYETSQLDPIDGIRFRGYSIADLKEKLPKAPGCKEPMPEGLFYLMLIGEIPTQEEVASLSREWQRRAHVPVHTFKVLDSMPRNTHPMTQFSTAIISMQTGSVFARRYEEGFSKADHWDATYEDTMNILARLPRIAAYIYRRTYHNDDHIESNITLDWAGNFAHMLGVTPNPDFKSLMRLYLTLHADHEGGNASAHTTHLVGTTLSDAYFSLSAGMNALAGPLHGLANQEVIKWVLTMVDILGTMDPSKEQITQYVHNTIAAGKVIPGYGHAVLRQPDPRFTAQKQFAEDYISDSPIIKVIWKVFDVVPPILQSMGKVKNPWPNVDAHSGALLVNYGMKEYSYYTVLFGVSRAMGVLSALCWSRALGLPLERPKSVTTDWVKEFLKKQAAEQKA
jgi:citrate synthase